MALTTAAKNTCLSEGAPVNTTAMLTLQNGVATVHCAAVEVGQGMVTIFRQIVQSSLGVSEVEITGQDTLMAPAATTDAQQQTVTSGTAVQQAAVALKQQFLRFVGRVVNRDPARLDVHDDHVVDATGRRLALCS